MKLIFLNKLKKQLSLNTTALRINFLKQSLCHQHGKLKVKENVNKT